MTNSCPERRISAAERLETRHREPDCRQLRCRRRDVSCDSTHDSCQRDRFVLQLAAMSDRCPQSAAGDTVDLMQLPELAELRLVDDPWVSVEQVDRAPRRLAGQRLPLDHQPGAARSSHRPALEVQAGGGRRLGQDRRRRPGRAPCRLVRRRSGAVGDGHQEVRTLRRAPQPRRAVHRHDGPPPADLAVAAELNEAPLGKATWNC